MDKPFIKANLLRCPSCEILGYKQTLGKLLPNGNVAIEKMNSSHYLNEVIVSGDSFTLICGKCNEPVFYRKGDNLGTLSTFRQSWTFGVTSAGTA